MTTSTAATTATTANASAVSTLISSLGAGSGIDMTALAANLATAQFAARSDLLTTKASTLDTQISAASNLKSMMLSLSSSLASRVRQGDLSPQPVIANPAVATATTSGASTPSGSYSLEVTALASSQTLASPAYPSAASVVGAGTLTLRFGTISGTGFSQDGGHAAVGVSIAAGATLADVASAINAANAGVSAYVANTTAGAKLVLKGQQGAADGFVLDASEDPAHPGLANLAWSAAGDPARRLTSAGDAALKIDGLPLGSASNTLANAIPGVTLNLAGTNAGAPTTVSFADQSSAITSAMTDLTSALSAIASELGADMTAGSGALVADSGARSLRAALSQLTTKVVMPGAPAGAPSTLADLGLSIQRDGTFKLDGARLAATLAAYPQQAAAMFTTGVSGVYATIDSLARASADVGDPGSIGASVARLTSAKTDVTQNESDLAAQQEALRTELVSRFADTNTRIGAYKSTLTFLENQIAAWNAGK